MNTVAIRDALLNFAESEIWAWELTSNGVRWGLVSIGKVEYHYPKGPFMVTWSFADDVARFDRLGDEDDETFSPIDFCPTTHVSRLSELFGDKGSCLASLKLRIIEVLPQADAVESMTAALKEAETNPKG